MTVANRPDSLLVLPSNVLALTRIDDASYYVDYTVVGSTTITYDVISAHSAMQLGRGRPIVVHRSSFNFPHHDSPTNKQLRKAHIIAVRQYGPNDYDVFDGSHWSMMVEYNPLRP